MVGVVAVVGVGVGVGVATVVLLVAGGAVVDVVAGAGGSEVVVERGANPMSTAEIGGDETAPHAVPRTTVNISPKGTNRRWPRMRNVGRHFMTRNIGSPAAGA